MARIKYVEGVGPRNYTAEEEAVADAIEKEHNDNLVGDLLKQFRVRRNALLADTDFYALSDVTMSEDMTTYRQELRDLPSGLSTVDDVNNTTFPTKP